MTPLTGGDLGANVLAGAASGAVSAMFSLSALAARVLSQEDEGAQSVQGDQQNGHSAGKGHDPHDPVYCGTAGSPKCGDPVARQLNKTPTQSAFDSLAWRYRDSNSPFAPGGHTAVVESVAGSGLEEGTIGEASGGGTYDLGRYKQGTQVHIDYPEPHRGTTLAALIHGHPTGDLLTWGDVDGARAVGVPVYMFKPLAHGAGFFVWEPVGGRMGTITQVYFP